MPRHQQRALPTSLLGTLSPAGSLINTRLCHPCSGFVAWLWPFLWLPTCWGLGKTLCHPAVSRNATSTDPGDLHRATHRWWLWLRTIWSGERNVQNPWTKRKCHKCGGRVGEGVHKNYFCIFVPRWPHLGTVPCFVLWSLDPWYEPIWKDLSEPDAANCIHPHPCPHPSPRSEKPGDPPIGPPPSPVFWVFTQLQDFQGCLKSGLPWHQAFWNSYHFAY